MDIFVIDRQLKSIASISNAKSIVWTSRLWGHSSVAVQLDCSQVELLQDAWGIQRDDDDEIMRITSIKMTGESLEVDATAFTQAFERRAIVAVSSFSGVDVASVIRSLVNAAMSASTKLPGISRSFSFIDNMPQQPPSGKQITRTVSHGVVFDEIKAIIDTAPLRFYISHRIPSIYVGADLSKKVIFSDDFGDIASFEFARNTLDMANMAVVCGSGEGDARLIAIVDKRTSGNDELYELFVDDTSESTTNLIKRGENELANLPVVLSLEAEVASQRNHYRRDFNLGDTVSYETTLASGTDIVSEVEETFENGSYQVRISLGQTAPTVKEYIDKKIR